MPPLIVAAVIAAGSAVASAEANRRSSNKASKTQAEAADKALAFETRQYDDEQSRLKPYREMSGQAYQRMGTMLGLEPTPAPAAAPPAAMPRPSQPAAPDSFSFSRQPAPAAPMQFRGTTQHLSGAPQMGQRKTFPNGRIGEWDGRGWKAVS